MRRLGAQQASCCCGRFGCGVGSHLRRLTRARVRLQAPTSVGVKTWCRVCGLPVLVNVVLEYDYAVRHFFALDDQPMVHRQLHAEVGGWGVHWRLDDVLRVVFPRQHEHDNWIKTDWYKHDQAEELPVEVLDAGSINQYREETLCRLEHELELQPVSREDLEDYGPVWDENEFSQMFENLGFRPPFVLVKKLRNGERGTVIFQNHPRLYFGYDRDRVI